MERRAEHLVQRTIVPGQRSSHPVHIPDQRLRPAAHDVTVAAFGHPDNGVSVACRGGAQLRLAGTAPAGGLGEEEPVQGGQGSDTEGDAEDFRFCHVVRLYSNVSCFGGDTFVI